MKILVTGGAGYVGSMLVPILLSAGHTLRVFDSLNHGGASLLSVWSDPAFEFRRADIRDRRAVRSALSGMEAVIHLAGVVGDPACARDPHLARAVNLQASLALIEDSQRAGVERFVFASTCSNYGKMKDANHYVDEESELSPVSLYAETKVAVEKSLLARRLVVFGEQFWRPYLHVRDAARAIKLVLESPAAKVAGRVFNVGATDQNFQKQQLIELISPHAPDAVVEFVHKTEDPRDYRVSFSRISEQLGFQITRTVTEGIAEVARLVRENVINDFENRSYRN